jgi:predicted AlkP superfamily pyrophosphatase or phosphodiesterase
MNPDFIKPRYDEGGFAGIPNRIKEAFASKKYDAVVLFLIDAFGWRFFEKFQSAPFLKRMAKQGTIQKITSQFPSTTAAHVTTIHTGLPVGVSGVYEWFYYEPQLDAVIAPLLFSYAGSNYREQLADAGIHPSLIYPRGTLYPELKNMGVSSYYFGSREHTPSTYSITAMAGAELRGFKTLPEAITNLGLLLEKAKTPTYIHLYFDKIDSICHEYGPESPQTDSEIETFLLMMEHYFERIFKGKKRILFLMTADHGAAEVDPKTTTYLNRGPTFVGFERFLKTNRKGQLIVPAGSPRDMFLYIEDHRLDEAQEFLAKRLEGKADVVKTEFLIEQGYFGPEVSQPFLSRVGNLVLLPYRYKSVWWYEKGKFEMKYFGHHGGLTPQEMETVLYSVPLG